MKKRERSKKDIEKKLNKKEKIKKSQSLQDHYEDNKILYDKDHRIYIFKCPHCDLLTIVGKNESNCCIFRHAVFKSTY